MNEIIKRNCVLCEKEFECRTIGNKGKSHKGKIFRGINAITCSSKCSKEYGKRNKKEKDLCVMCKKNKATITFANSTMDYIHGFASRICQQCYDEIRNKNPWFQEGKIIGREEQKKEVLKLIDEDIKIQKEFLKKQPQNKKSIEWRIIGMRLLRLEINEKKERGK